MTADSQLAEPRRKPGYDSWLASGDDDNSRDPYTWVDAVADKGWTDFENPSPTNKCVGGWGGRGGVGIIGQAE